MFVGDGLPASCNLEIQNLHPRERATHMFRGYEVWKTGAAKLNYLKGPC